MTSLSTIAAESSQCYQLVTSGPSQIEISGGWLEIKWSNRNARKKVRADKIEWVSIGRSWFWDTLSVRLEDGEEHSVGGLTSGLAVRLRDALVGDAERIKAEVKAALLLATTVGDEIMQIEDEINRLFSGENYVRHSEALDIHGQLETTMQKCTELVQECLIPGALSAFRRLERFRTLEVFEKERCRSNDAFIQKSIPAVKLAAESDFGITLTDEQALAIATDEEATLVLAGAGTGKTAVITGKISHLVRNGGVSPAEILVLAFNRTAAEEIRDRLPQDLKGARVSTFHSFGYSVIGRGGIRPSISKLAQDERLLGQAVHDALDEILGQSDQSEDVRDFIAYHRAPYHSPFEFKNRGEYYEYVRDWEPRTLSGDLVKSQEEVEIANFLTLNGIDFDYEGDYLVDTATSVFRQYQPDFYLPDYDIYIEHFALDENGNAPSGWDGYEEGVEWKRMIHAQHSTRLIETYSWQRKQGILRIELQKRLAAHGVAFKNVSFLDALRRLAEWVISWLARLLTTFLRHVKSSGLSRDQLRERTLVSLNPVRSRSFLGVFEKVRDRYDAMLKMEDAVDFHDLINDAATLIRNGREHSRFRYVLVDEFQDISTGRMRLLDAFYQRSPAYFVVGDDWQSIYRFAGSDVSLVQDCGQYLGHVQQRELTETFRFGDGILAPSTNFVQRNPEQTQRTLRSASSHRGDAITIVSDKNVESALRGTLRDIEKRLGTQPAHEVSILVLGRYRNSEQHLRAVRSRDWRFDLRFSTVHRAKGQEADYVIVLDLKNARSGFPAKIEDDPLLEMVLPPKSAKGLPYAEERRLFYVAMTRARRGAYLIADDSRPSEFVTEIRKYHPDVRQIGALAAEEFPNCPKCKSGQLVPSQSGGNLRCTNYPMCSHLAPRCDGCHGGFLADLNLPGFFSCTSADCDLKRKCCPSCRVGMLRKRDGKYGEFWGCTEYWSEPPCRYTEPIRTESTRSQSGAPSNDAVGFRGVRSRQSKKR